MQFAGMDNRELTAHIGQFWSWWSTELKQCIPRQLLQHFYPDTPEVLVAIREGEARFYQSTEATSEPFITVKLDELERPERLAEVNATLSTYPQGTYLAVTLGAQQTLCQQVQLPIATESNLDSVIRFEIDRLTPYSPDEVLHAHRIIGRHPETDQIAIELDVVPRALVKALMESLSSLCLPVLALYPHVGEENHWPASKVNMLGAEQKNGDSRFNQRTRYSAVAVAALLLLVLALPIMFLNMKSQDLEARLDAVRQQGSQLSEQRAMLDERHAARSELLRRRQEMPSKLQLIDELTRLLPDHTWVSRLSVEDTVVKLAGESSEASQLIEILDQSPNFHNVRFDSPVIRNSRSEQDRYEIRLELGAGS